MIASLGGHVSKVPEADRATNRIVSHSLTRTRLRTRFSVPLMLTP